LHVRSKAEVYFCQKSKGTRGKGNNKYTGSKIGFSWFNTNETIETNWSRDSPRLKSDILRRGCRLQDRGAVQGRSVSRQHVVSHRRGGRKVRFARGGIREHEAFLCHEIRGPAGTGRGGVSMAVRPKRKEGEWGEGSSLVITAMFVLRIYSCISAFCLDKEGC